MSAATTSKSVSPLRIALAGNPNSGKTTLFNALTGLNQRIGNYPGVTVDKKTGTFKLHGNGVPVQVVDLPGAYSLKPNSEDERVTAAVLTDSNHADFPTVTVYVADASNLKRSLLFCSQLIDRSVRMVLAVNMVDEADRKGLTVDTAVLETQLGIKVVAINARKRIGFDELQTAIEQAHEPQMPFLVDDAVQGPRETIARYQRLSEILALVVTQQGTPAHALTAKFDKVLTHPVWGYVVFLSLMLLVFQAIFAWSEAPMNWIESGFGLLSSGLTEILPEGALRDLLIDGVLAGLAGVVIFIPQIAILFFFVAVMEESGYMARVSFLLDKMMRSVGLNGKSVIPLIGGMACAVPSIMSARTIGNWKERLITIMVTPLISCSARLPVYALLITVVIPSEKYVGPFSYQALTMMALYLLGFVAAALSALVFKYLIRSKERSFFIMEMPDYRSPRWANIGLTIFEKVKVFVVDAGKIIVAISIVLWVLASFGPGDSFEQIDAKYASLESAPANVEQLIASEKQEASYAGVLGHAIEPVIRPLGFDWKIGIALIASFAAREVFVGTMSTIYRVGDEEDFERISEAMLKEKHADTGLRVWTLAAGLSLMVFYAFAMQCMSTIAVVYRETKHWKWPAIQLVYMTALAWLSSWAVYHIFG